MLLGRSLRAHNDVSTKLINNVASPKEDIEPKRDAPSSPSTI